MAEPRRRWPSRRMLRGRKHSASWGTRLRSMPTKKMPVEPGGLPAGPAPNLNLVTARKNLNETAFFFPQLTSDANGVVRMTFTMPEALTRWHFMGFAHDPSVRSGFLEGHAVTVEGPDGAAQSRRVFCARAIPSSSPLRSPISRTKRKPGRCGCQLHRYAHQASADQLPTCCSMWQAWRARRARRRHPPLWSNISVFRPRNRARSPGA